ncbi:hypothetical protein ACLOJK_022072 [Asimina triloba]
MIRKLRWATDCGFWDLDMSTPVTIDGTARAVPGDVIPLGLSRGTKLSMPKQLDFMHRFMATPLVPSYSGNDGFSLQRAISLPLGENFSHWPIPDQAKLCIPKIEFGIFAPTVQVPSSSFAYFYLNLQPHLANPSWIVGQKQLSGSGQA